MISDEPMRNLWDGLASELAEIAAPSRLPDGFLQETLIQFHDEGFGGYDDIFELFTLPAEDGCNELNIRISSNFIDYATSAAKNHLGGRSH